MEPLDVGGVTAQGHGAGATAKATAHRGTARPRNGMTAEGQLHTAELLNCVNAKLHGTQNYTARKTTLHT